MISAVVLSHNNAAIIKKTLISLSWCDEIIMIDDDSSDETVVLAEKLGVRVFQHRLEGNFAAQRNFALEKTKSDWVFFVDSDEIVPAALAREIQHAILDNGIDGYMVRRKDTLFGKTLNYG